MKCDRNHWYLWRSAGLIRQSIIFVDFIASGNIVTLFNVNVFCSTFRRGRMKNHLHRCKKQRTVRIFTVRQSYGFSPLWIRAVETHTTAVAFRTQHTTCNLIDLLNSHIFSIKKHLQLANVVFIFFVTSFSSFKCSMRCSYVSNSLEISSKHSAKRRISFFFYFHTLNGFNIFCGYFGWFEHTKHQVSMWNEFFSTIVFPSKQLLYERYQ